MSNPQSRLERATSGSVLNQSRHRRRRWYSAAGTTVPMTARLISACFRPEGSSSVSSQTAYSSDVRCGSVAMRQMPRQVAPSCTAKTTFVLPASTTSSTPSPHPLAGSHRSAARAPVRRIAAAARHRRPGQRTPRPGPCRPSRTRMGLPGRGPRASHARRTGAKPSSKRARSQWSSRVSSAARHRARRSGGPGTAAVRGRSGAAARLAPKPITSHSSRPAPSSAVSSQDAADLRTVQQHVVGPLHAKRGAGRCGLDCLSQREGRQQGPLARLHGRAARAEQHGQRQVARQGLPAAPAAAARLGLPRGGHGQPGRLPSLRQRDAEVGGGCQALVMPQPPARRRGWRHPNSTRAADWAAATSGAGKTKNNVVTSAPRPATNDTDAGRASNAGSALSKYITLITRR